MRHLSVGEQGPEFSARKNHAVASDLVPWVGVAHENLLSQAPLKTRYSLVAAGDLWLAAKPVSPSHRKRERHLPEVTFECLAHAEAGANQAFFFESALLR